jgi:hypothetical protein
VKDLTYKQILALKPGRHWASECLYVFVAPNRQTRRFIFRFTKPITGKSDRKGTWPVGSRHHAGRGQR